MTDSEDGAKESEVKKLRRDNPTEKMLPSAEETTAADAVIVATQTTSSESVSTGLLAVLIRAKCCLIQMARRQRSGVL